jgi:glycosyltransferase involved in cell wall biosynthesis
MRRAVDPQRALHIVQIGYDDSVFREGAPSDTLKRQLGYGRTLDGLHPGSRMSVLMFTGDGKARAFRQGNVAFVPVHPKGPLGLLALYRTLAAVHQEAAIDAVATQTVYEDAWIALLFGKRRGINVVGQVHNDFFSPIARRAMLGGGLLGRARAAMGSSQLRNLHAVRVVGKRVRDRMTSEGLHGNVHVIPVPVTMQAPAGESAQEEMGRPRVLFVGRLVEEKNLEDWLRVAALVAEREPGAEFEIVGDGPCRPHLEKLAGELGIAQRVRFRGFVPYEELRPIYASSAVFLITSHCEGFGRVVVESCLQQLPVVGTRITGVEDIVEDGRTGLLHSSGDVDGMAGSVVAILRDQELRRQMGQAAREHVTERFDPERLSRSWMSLLVAAARWRGMRR